MSVLAIPTDRLRPARRHLALTFFKVDPHSKPGEYKTIMLFEVRPLTLQAKANCHYLLFLGEIMKQNATNVRTNITRIVYIAIGEYNNCLYRIVILLNQSSTSTTKLAERLG